MRLERESGDRLGRAPTPCRKVAENAVTGVGV